MIRRRQSDIALEWMKQTFLSLICKCSRQDLATSHTQYGQIVGLSGRYSFHVDMDSSQTSPVQDTGISNINKGD